MTKCSECGTEISTKAEACPKCGAKRPKKTSGCAIIVGACFALFIVAPMVMVSVQDRKPATPEQQQQSEEEVLAAEACERAKEAVLAVLKAPSTADFPGCIFGRDQIEIRANPEKTVFWVSSWVDSQNSFGAKIRSKWMVKLSRPAGAKNFTVEKTAVE